MKLSEVQEQSTLKLSDIQEAPSLKLSDVRAFSTPSDIRTYDLIEALVKQERGRYDETNVPLGDNGKSRGPLQISKDYVTDVNGFIGEDKYTWEDADDPVKAREMTEIYVKGWAKIHVNDRDVTVEDYARFHQGGPTAVDRRSVVNSTYWRNVNKRLPVYPEATQETLAAARQVMGKGFQPSTNYESVQSGAGEAHDPSEPPDFSKPGRAYPLAEPAARVYGGFAEGVMPGARKGLLQIGARTPEERKVVENWADTIRDMPWYEKIPEAWGYGAEKVLEYKALSGLFKVTGLGRLLDVAGAKVASRVVGNELTKAGGKSALLNYGGFKTFARNVARQTIASLPKTTQFLGIWGGTESARRGEGFSEGYFNGMKWGAVLSAAFPFVIESAKAGMNTKAFEKAVTRFDVTFPNLSTKLKGEPSMDSMVKVLEDVKHEAAKEGVRLRDDLNITHLNETGRNVIKSLARRYEAVASKRQMQMIMQKGPPEVVSKAAADVVVKDVERNVLGQFKKKVKVGKPTGKSLNELKKEVHKVAKEKKIGDMQRRQIYFGQTGKLSAKDMNAGEINAVIKNMQNTDTIGNFMVNNRALKTQDTGADILSTDKNIYNEQGKAIKKQRKKVQKTNKKVEAKKKKGEQHNYFDWYAPERIAMAQFEDNTSIPISYKDHLVKRKAKITSHEAKESFGKMLAGLPHDKKLTNKENRQVVKGIQDAIAETSVEENDRIAKWLYGEVTESGDRVRPDIKLTPKEMEIAKKFEYIAQESPMAMERMEEHLRRWITRGKAPSDIKKFSKEQQKVIFDGAKKARKAGMLKEYTKGLFNNNVRFGLRQFYYPAQGEETDIIADYLKGASQDPLQGPISAEATVPALIGKETMARKGVGTPKAGSIYNNFMNSYERVSVRNAVADDLEELYRRFNFVELSPLDKRYLDDLYSKVLLKGELLVPPYRGVTKLHSLFWRTFLSPVTNTYGAIRATTRNSLQLLSEAGHSVNLRSFYKHGTRIALSLAKGEGLEGINPQLSADFNKSFSGYISQKGSIYRDAMFIELGRKAKAENWPAAIKQKFSVLLDKTGFAYVGVDTLSRMTLWPTVYETVRDAATRYKAGDISYKKYLNITQVDTLMRDAQIDTARELLSSGDTRALANYVADTYTFDVFRAYTEEERAGIERTREQRALVGIYTYFRGVVDEFTGRGFKPLYDGIISGNIPKAKRGAVNIAKGIVGRGVANAILVGLGLGSLYSLWRVFYTPLQPAVNITADTMGKVSMVMYRYDEGEIERDAAITAIAEIIYKGTDDLVHFLPELKKKDETEGVGSRAGRRARTSRESR